ncbi:hypothetical protein N9079_01650 [bacterium]|nr:hypothetical protein [bacterium]
MSSSIIPILQRYQRDMETEQAVSEGCEVWMLRSAVRNLQNEKMSS